MITSFSGSSGTKRASSPASMKRAHALDRLRIVEDGELVDERAVMVRETSRPSSFSCGGVA